MKIWADGGWFIGAIFPIIFVVLFLFLLSRLGLSMPSRYVKEKGDGEAEVREDQGVNDNTKAPVKATHDSEYGARGGGHHGEGTFQKVLGFGFAVLILGAVAYVLFPFVERFMHPLPYNFSARDGGRSQLTSKLKAQRTLDLDSSHYCKNISYTADSYPANTEWTEVAVQEGGYEFCTNPAPALGLTSFECKTDANSQWDKCGRYFLFVRFRSHQTVRVWQEAHR